MRQVCPLYLHRSPEHRQWRNSSTSTTNFQYRNLSLTNMKSNRARIYKNAIPGDLGFCVKGHLEDTDRIAPSGTSVGQEEAGSLDVVGEAYVQASLRGRWCRRLKSTVGMQAWRGRLKGAKRWLEALHHNETPRRQKSAPTSPPIGLRVSAALKSRDLGDRRATLGDAGWLRPYWG